MDFWSFQYFFTVIVPILVAILIGTSIEQFIESRITSFGEGRDLLSTQIDLMKLIVRWLFVFILIFIIAGILGVTIGSLWISISAILSMIIIGFVAGWSLIANILAAIIVMIWRPFKIGDYIALLPEDVSGEVKEINMFYGELETEEGERIEVPNVFFLQKFIKVTSDSKSRDKV